MKPAHLLVLVLLAVAAPAWANSPTASWMHEENLDQGVYVGVQHPHVIRNPRNFDVSVVVSNLAAEGPIELRGVRYRIAGQDFVRDHARDDTLLTQRTLYRRFTEVDRALRSFDAPDEAPTIVEGLMDERFQLAVKLARAAVRDEMEIDVGLIPEVGASLDLTVAIDVIQGGQPRTLTRLVSIPVQPELPSGVDGDWFAGDQHLHTWYSIDAFALDFTSEDVRDYGHTAQAVGLDWATVTDHTNVDFLIWYTEAMFDSGELMARDVREREGYLLLQGQEMGVGSHGWLGESAHLLVYPQAVDSTGFLPNPCPGLLFNHVNCEREQVVLDRVNDNGGIGFIAHPFDSQFMVYEEWRRKADIVGWAGIEIFNSSKGVLDSNDEKSIDWWHEKLAEVARPTGGQLPLRPDFPTRFPVGIGNSDAHEPQLIGKTFTYCRLRTLRDSPTREEMMDGLLAGRCVASNGPLVYGQMAGANLGEVARISGAGHRLDVTLQTTSELGPVGYYEIVVLVDGEPRRVIAPNGSPDYIRTVSLDSFLTASDKFVTLRARRTDGVYHAIGNPIWLEWL